MIEPSPSAPPSQKPPGIVFLVGAGPGDPGLITVRGAELLASADVVVYDALANPQLLTHCPPAAELIYVGKRAAAHALPQDQINALLVDKARLGLRVVRLKGGDPFIFGRGGEECEALADAHIPFQVVPGITAAIAAPAYAGIPVTHRDFNSSFTFITGHEKEEQYQSEAAKARTPGAGSSDLDFAAIARLPCIAFYMAIKSLPRTCAKLIENGLSPETPAAAIQWGTTPRQRTLVATAATLAQKVADAALGAPAIILIGKVVSLRDRLNWFESQPLFGQTIVVTRTRQQASDLSDKLLALGAAVIEAPTIELAPPADWTRVDAALAAAHAYHWIVFTSANGVLFTKRRLLEKGLDSRIFGAARFAAIGPATAEAVWNHLAIRVDETPAEFVAEALADSLIHRGEASGRRFLLLRADIARPVLKQKLLAAGAAAVDDIAIYDTRLPPALPPDLLEALDAGRVNWITFASSSTAANFAALLGDDYRAKLAHTRLASIGPITTATLNQLGLPPAVQASQYAIDGLVAAILAAPPL